MYECERGNYMTDKKYVTPSKEELKERSTDIQYRVTQENGTERPFDNEFWDNDKEGYGKYVKLFKENRE